MSSFNRKEEFKNLPEEKKEKVLEYEKNLRATIKQAGLTADEKELTNALLDFCVSSELTDHYRQRYNKQARLINNLIKNKYVGNDYKKAQDWANNYSKEVAILDNLKYRFEKYQGIARGLASNAEQSDKKIDEALQEKGYLDERAKAPKKRKK